MNRTVAAVLTAAVALVLGLGCSSSSNEPAVLRTDKVEAPTVAPVNAGMPKPKMDK